MNPKTQSVQPPDPAESEDIVMRLAARYGTRETLQVDADGKTVAMRTIAFDEHSLRQFFEAIKRGET